jgi:hypothetical protein
MDEQMTIALHDQSSSEDFFLPRMLTDEFGESIWASPLDGMHP